MSYPPDLNINPLAPRLAYNTKRNGQRSTVFRDNKREDLILVDYRIEPGVNNVVQLSVGHDAAFEFWRGQSFNDAEGFNLANVRLLIDSLFNTPEDIILRLRQVVGGVPQEVLASSNQYAWDDPVIVAGIGGFIPFIFSTTVIWPNTDYIITIETTADSPAGSYWLIASDNAVYPNGSAWLVFDPAWPPDAIGAWNPDAHDIVMQIYSDESGPNIQVSEDFGYSYERKKSWPDRYNISREHGCCFTWDGHEYMAFYKDTSNNLYYIRSKGRMWDDSEWILLHIDVDHFAVCTTRKEVPEYLTHVVFTDVGKTTIFMNTHGLKGWGFVIGGATSEIVDTFEWIDPVVPERYIACEAIDGYCYILWDDYYLHMVHNHELRLGIVQVQYDTPEEGGIIYIITPVIEIADAAPGGGAIDGFNNPSLVMDSAELPVFAYEIHNFAPPLSEITTQFRNALGAYSGRNPIATGGAEYNPATSISEDDKFAVYCVDAPDSDHGVIAQINMWKTVSLPGVYGAFSNIELTNANWIFRDPKSCSLPYGSVAPLLYVLNQPAWNETYIRSRGNIISYEDGSDGPPPLPWGDGNAPVRSIVIVNGIIQSGIINISERDDLTLAKGISISFLNALGEKTDMFALKDTVEIWESVVKGSPGQKVFEGCISKIEYGEEAGISAINNVGILDWDVVTEPLVFNGITTTQALLYVIALNSYGFQGSVTLSQDYVIKELDLQGKRLLQALKLIIAYQPPEPKVVIESEGTLIIIREVET